MGGGSVCLSVCWVEFPRNPTNGIGGKTVLTKNSNLPIITANVYLLFDFTLYEDQYLWGRPNRLTTRVHAMHLVTAAGEFKGDNRGGRCLLTIL